VTTIERRLSALNWHYAQRGQPLDRKDRHIATVLAGIRNTHAQPPRQKEAVLPDNVIAMIETLDRGGLCGLRDRAMLLLGFAGGLRRSEIVGLDVGRGQTADGRGRIEILDQGMVVTLRGKTGWREVEVGRGSSEATCPVVALQTWLKLARIGHGPLFRRVTGHGKEVGPDRSLDQERRCCGAGRSSYPRPRSSSQPLGAGVSRNKRSQSRPAAARGRCRPSPVSAPHRQ
jgi:integrase